MKHYTGIDNGLDGGVVTLDSSGSVIQAHPMPTVKLGKGREIDILSLQSLVGDSVVFVEEAAKHSAGVLALCSTWFSYGQIVSMLKLGRVTYQTVNPQKWQKAFWSRPTMAKGTKFDTKAAALNACRKLWPEQTWLATTRSKVPHDGLCDSALLAEYGRRLYR